MGESIRVLVVQTGVLMRRAVVQRLESSGATVVGQAQTNAEALVEYAQRYPDVVTVDVRLGPESGLVLIQDLIECHPDAVVVVYSGHGDMHLARQALAVGAAGYICRGASRAELWDSLQRAVDGVRPVLDRRLVEVRSESVPAPAAGPVPQLTTRQRQVLHLVAAGTTSNKELAKELFISEKTVKSHIERITANLDVSRRTQLPLRALELGLLPVPEQPPSHARAGAASTKMAASRITG